VSSHLSCLRDGVSRHLISTKDEYHESDARSGSANGGQEGRDSAGTYKTRQATRLVFNSLMKVSVQGTTSLFRCRTHSGNAVSILKPCLEAMLKAWRAFVNTLACVSSWTEMV
jgi:hypothetical protein